MGLLLALRSSYIQRFDLDGSSRLTLHSGGYPVAVDYDYRCDNWLAFVVATLSYLKYTLICH